MRTRLDEIVLQAHAMLYCESTIALDTVFHFVASAAFREGAAQCAIAVLNGERDVLNYPGRVQPEEVRP